MAGKDNEAVYLRAFQNGGYWTIKIGGDRYDSEGTADEVLTLREVSQAPRSDDAVDQAWVVLVTALHILEKHGAMGRISGADWPALPIKLR